MSNFEMWVTLMWKMGWLFIPCTLAWLLGAYASVKWGKH